MRRNRANLIRLAGYYRRLELGFSCIYCGEDATSRDHFIPVSVAAMYAGLAVISPSAKLTLPCCHDCNCVACAKVFKTVGAKRRYIQARLAVKHKRLLASPDWSREEIEKLGYALRSKILADARLAVKIERRIGWRNNRSNDAIGSSISLVSHFEGMG